MGPLYHFYLTVAKERYVFISVCTDVCVQVCVRVCVYRYVYVYMYYWYVCVYRCMCVSNNTKRQTTTKSETRPDFWFTFIHLSQILLTWESWPN